jgi:iduronate 2-sulfatase
MPTPTCGCFIMKFIGSLSLALHFKRCLREALVVCCAWLLMCPVLVRGQEPPALDEIPRRIVVLSYNIHHAEGVDGQLDLDRIADVIRAAKPDIVALQEVDQGVARSENVDQPRQLAQRLGMHFTFGGNIDLEGGKYGNALLSRFPIEKSTNHPLPNVGGGEQRGVIEADLKLSGSVTLKFLATHLDHRREPAQRLASAEFINQLLEQSAHRPLCLAGDLNAVPESSVLVEFKKQWHLSDLQHQPTIPVNRPNRKIDYVLVSQTSPEDAVEIREVESRVLEEAVASDHRPLLSVLELKPNKLAAVPPNVLLICVDDLRPELNCYGVDYIQSPNIDRCASRGAMFTRHYVQAPTCGASRFALLTGRYGGRSNEALFQRASRLGAGKADHPSLPEWFRRHGYYTSSIGKVSHHPGGRGGADWNDPEILEMPQAWDRHVCPSGDWQHPRGFMHGLAHGEIRTQTENMDVFQSVIGDDSIYPDGLTTAEAQRQLVELAKDKQRPFFLAVGILRPHLPFGAPAKYMQPYQTVQLPPIAHPHKPAGKTTWHSSSEFMKYNRWQRNPNQDADFGIQVRKHYAACVTYADAQVGEILDQLEACGAADNTIVVIWGDHGWHLGEHAIWGKHALFEESLRSPLIVCVPGKTIPSASTIESIVETVDIFPTLCELAHLPQPEFVDGQSLVGTMQGQPDEQQLAISYFKQARSLRTDRYRLVAHRDGHRELYDHQAPVGESKNMAASAPEQCEQLLQLLDARYPDSPE